MPATFSYKARDRQGKILAGTLESDSQATVVAKLRQMGYIVFEVAQEREAKATLGSVIKIVGGKKVKAKDLTIFSRQF
ncbi:MAG: hypothetical protein Q8M92_07690, partial [Candidatus Subteraquimicrobiales bacterium]|nr:hypothetical protein [Candidatus Subteraquimicrobiales bacterium]